MFDTALSRHGFPAIEFQRVAMAALLLASKIESRGDVLTLDDYVAASAPGAPITVDQVRVWQVWRAWWAWRATPHR